MALVVKNSLANAEDIRDVGAIPGGRDGNPPQYSCLENPMDRGAWWATIHGVTESDTTERTSTQVKVGASPVARLVKTPQCRRPWFNSWIGKIRWRRDRLPLEYSWASSAAQLVKNRWPMRSQRGGRDCVTEHTGRILNMKTVSGSSHMLLKAKHFLSLKKEGGNRKVIQREVKHEKTSVHCCWL